MVKQIKLLLAIIALFAGYKVPAQTSWEPGYIITAAERDTIPGYILEKTDADLAKGIFFRSSKGLTSKKYRPEDLLGFAFNNGRTFERQKLPSEKDGKEDYIFSKNLVKGKIDLFVLRHPHRSKPDIFLFNNETGGIVHLKNPGRKEIIERDGKEYVADNTRFTGYLNLIKEDSLNTLVKAIPVEYSEKRIKKDIVKYNSQFKEEYPVAVYREELKYNYNFLLGLPVSSLEAFHFRGGVYRIKRNIERTSNFSFMQGIVYHHWSNEDNNYINIDQGSANYRWQLLNLIPLGVSFHGEARAVQPYGYVGLGVGAGLLTDHTVENFMITGSNSSIIILPSLNLGIGAKIRMGKNYLVTELTPTINGIFFNLGFSV